MTVDDQGRARKLVLRAAGLRALAGPQQGQLLRVSGNITIIGSHVSCDVVLDDPTVSSRHAEIAVRPEGYLLRDLGSRNGVFAGNWRVTSLYLSPAMVLTMGNATLEVVDLNEVTEVPLSAADRFGDVVGRSTSMRALFSILDSVARSDATVLLCGETGTGKEVLGRALHEQSPRSDGPFVVLDCGAIPANLLESTLFGHERGAFTGAETARAGALELADGGSLFLDEIGELDLQLQPKLLRAVETREYTRLGGRGSRRADVRFIAATRRNLEHEVRQGNFRRDLFYRLAVVHVRVPPLRERLDDLPQLAEQLSRALGEDHDVLAQFPGILPLLMSYSWPGNVRELRNVVERLHLVPLDQALLGMGGLTGVVRGSFIPLGEARDRVVEQFERSYVEDLLRHTKGNVTRAAKLAGVSRRHLTQLVARHKVDRRDLGWPR